MKKSLIGLAVSLLMINVVSNPVWAQAAPAASSATAPEFAGKIFGQDIPVGNYYFVLKVVTTFGTPWGGIPANQEQLKRRVEDDLLLSFESFRRDITVEQADVEKEITATLNGHKVDFDWQQNGEAYAKWVKDTLNESVESFENQMKHLLQIKKLQRQILDEAEVSVTDEEAFQEFLNEYNTLGIELVQFDDPTAAEDFYQSAKKDPAFWDQEKAKDEKRFKRPGFVALEFLMNMWQLPKTAVYEMIEKEPGFIYPPTPIYRGKGVFKVLEVRRADENEFPRHKESYHDQLKTQKRYEHFNAWLENLRKESGIVLDVELPQLVEQKSE